MDAPLPKGPFVHPSRITEPADRRDSVQATFHVLRLAFNLGLAFAGRDRKRADDLLLRYAESLEPRGLSGSAAVFGRGEGEERWLVKWSVPPMELAPT